MTRLHRQRSLVRIVQVTAAISVLGAVAGAAIGAILVALLSARAHELGSGIRLIAFGAEFGAAMGFVLAPVASWTLMRHVPIWRAMAETALGTVLGAAIGLVLQPILHTALLSPVLLGVAGFAIAGIRLRVATRGRVRSADDGPPPP